MRAKLVRIGNSKGIRLPKPILEASGIEDEVDLSVEEGRIVLMPAKRHPREGWAEAIAAIGPDEEDWSDWLDMPSEVLDEEWTWPEDFEWPKELIVSTYISPSSIRSAVPKSPRRVRAPSSHRTK